MLPVDRANVGKNESEADKPEVVSKHFISLMLLSMIPELWRLPVKKICSFFFFFFPKNICFLSPVAGKIYFEIDVQAWICHG